MCAQRLHRQSQLPYLCLEDTTCLAAVCRHPDRIRQRYADLGQGSLAILCCTVDIIFGINANFICPRLLINLKCFHFANVIFSRWQVSSSR